MGDVFVRFLGMPEGVKGVVRLDDEGDYNIYLNPAHSHNVLKKTLDHEVRHIAHGHLEMDGAVDEMEVDADG